MKDGVHLRLPLPFKADCDQEYTDLMPASDTTDLPSASELGFNDSQYSAFKAAIVREGTSSSTRRLKPNNSKSSSSQ